PVLESIIQWHIKSTRYNIHVDEETGFVYGGTEGVQLTWMDAKVNDYVVTPRIGYPVEIQALWYNALNIYKSLLIDLNEDSFIYQPYLDKIKNNFSSHYWNEKEGYLYDFLDWHKNPNTDLRPNQIYAASLPFSLLSDLQTKRMIENVKTQLYTPYGLRTLNQKHIDFKATYQGNQYQRDSAYHQGTVWPFLLSEYFTILINLYGNKPETIQQIEESLIPLKEHFYKHECIHGISEIFDGDQPGEGKGTINQAWSVGALIQVLTKIEAAKIQFDKQRTPNIKKRTINNTQKETIRK
ncbi:MAG: amylo-alpha-1,6-glucosidase, partial [Saprospiraceae bacterium]